MSKETRSTDEAQVGEIFPSPLEFLIQAPLYKSYALTPLDNSWVNGIEFIEGSLDVYCVYCNDRSLFTRQSDGSYIPRGIGDHYFGVTLICVRNSSHSYMFRVRVEQLTIQKFGQYPSVADISIPQLVKYRSILGNERYREFTKAVGLAAHGVGIGSFVYLRRILESLIEEAHENAKLSTGWSEDAYSAGRVVEKIQFLKGHLPEFMIKHRSVYSILSKGIHELSEDECKRHFIPLKSAIELILNEHLIHMVHKRNVEEAERGLAEIHRELSAD